LNFHPLGYDFTCISTIYKFVSILISPTKFKVRNASQNDNY